MTYTIEEMMPLISEAVMKKRKLLQLPSGKRARLSSTLKIFHHCGVICAKCGVKGTIFREVRHDKKMHIRLLGIKDGKEVMMTKDHIIPHSKGGSNSSSNMQTMCCECNSEKQDEVSGDLVENSKYSYKSIKDYIFNVYPKSSARDRFSRDFGKTVRRVREHTTSLGLICGDLDEILQYLYDIKIKYGLHVPIEKLRRVPKEKSCLLSTQRV